MDSSEKTVTNPMTALAVVTSPRTATNPVVNPMTAMVSIAKMKPVAGVPNPGLRHSYNMRQRHRKWEKYGQYCLTSSKSDGHEDLTSSRQRKSRNLSPRNSASPMEQFTSLRKKSLENRKSSMVLADEGSGNQKKLKTPSKEKVVQQTHSKAVAAASATQTLSITSERKSQGRGRRRLSSAERRIKREPEARSPKTKNLGIVVKSPDYPRTQHRGRHSMYEIASQAVRVAVASPKQIQTTNSRSFESSSGKRTSSTFLPPRKLLNNTKRSRYAYSDSDISEDDDGDVKKSTDSGRSLTIVPKESNVRGNLVAVSSYEKKQPAKTIPIGDVAVSPKQMQTANSRRSESSSAKRSVIKSSTPRNSLNTKRSRYAYSDSDNDISEDDDDVAKSTNSGRSLTLVPKELGNLVAAVSGYKKKQPIVDKKTKTGTPRQKKIHKVETGTEPMTAVQRSQRFKSAFGSILKKQTEEASQSSTSSTVQVQRPFDHKFAKQSCKKSLLPKKIDVGTQTLNDGKVSVGSSCEDLTPSAGSAPRPEIGFVNVGNGERFCYFGPFDLNEIQQKMQFASPWLSVNSSERREIRLALPSSSNSSDSGVQQSQDLDHKENTSKAETKAIGEGVVRDQGADTGLTQLHVQNGSSPNSVPACPGNGRKVEDNQENLPEESPRTKNDRRSDTAKKARGPNAVGEQGTTANTETLQNQEYSASDSFQSATGSNLQRDQAESNGDTGSSDESSVESTSPVRNRDSPDETESSESDTEEDTDSVKEGVDEYASRCAIC